MFGDATRRFTRSFRTGDVEESRMPYRLARALLNAAEEEFEMNLQALQNTQEMFRYAQESLASVNHVIETILAEGPLQVEVPLAVYRQYRELRLRSLVH